MKSSEIRKVINLLKPHMPGFNSNGAMVYKEKNGVLHAIYVEDSGLDKKSFYVWVFFLPLYIPLKQLVFTFGKRLSNGRRWTSDAESTSLLEKEIKNEALPYLQRIYSAIKISHIIEGIDSGPTGNLNIRQALAYSHAREGDRVKSCKVLKEIIEQVNASKTQYPWKINIREQCRLMLTRIEDCSEMQLLEEYAEKSRKNLGLNQAL